METIGISLDGLRIYARHGVMEQERCVGNLFIVDISLEYPPALQAAADDDLSRTINYAELARIIKEQMEIPAELIENVAYRIRKAVVERWPYISSGKIRLVKPTPPIGGFSLDGASVYISW